MKQKESLRKAAQIIGSQAALAKKLGIGKSNISQWLELEGKVPAERCMDIEELTGGQILCEDLRPDLNWGVVRNSRSKP